MWCAWFWFSVAVHQQMVAAEMATPWAARRRHRRVIDRAYRPGSRRWREALRYSDEMIESYYYGRTYWR